MLYMIGDTGFTKAGNRWRENINKCILYIGIVLYEIKDNVFTKARKEWKGAFK